MRAQVPNPVKAELVSQHPGRATGAESQQAVLARGADAGSGKSLTARARELGYFFRSTAQMRMRAWGAGGPLGSLQVHEAEEALLIVPRGHLGHSMAPQLTAFVKAQIKYPTM